MSDARWGDPRECGERARDDERPRVYGERDGDTRDPRDGLMHDLDLPRGEERELVVDRARVYELNGEDSRTLAALGTFRVVPEPDLDIEHDTLGHLRAEGLVEAVDLGGDERGLVLTKQGRDLLDSHTLERDEGAPQAFYAGVSRSREIDHDSNLYSTYRQEEARLRDEHGIDIRRVILEQDLKREYQEFLQEHNRNRSDSDGRPDRNEGEIRDWAREHDLPYFDEQVHFPDYRIEYEVDGQERHQDVELFTEHYRGAHAASLSQTGFRITRDRVIKAVRGAQRVAGIEQGVHILRHTFCSHLAMKGAPARAIQELAGHADLSTTQRYMYLSPAATEDAIRLLDSRKAGLVLAENAGDILETREVSGESV